MAAYGLRPEELQHLQIRQGRLWCMYEKVASRGKTRPRVLRPLPSDDWADGWRLEERFPTQELPPMQPGLGGGYVGHYLMNRPLWKELRREYEAKGEKLVPYSCRHGYAHRAHVICDLPPKVVAAAMGHSVQTHLAAYSRCAGMMWWMTPLPRQRSASAWTYLLRTRRCNDARPARTRPTLVPPGLPVTPRLFWVVSSGWPGAASSPCRPVRHPGSTDPPEMGLDGRRQGHSWPGRDPGNHSG